MKKAISLFAAAVMAATMLAGCGSVKPNEVFSVADLDNKTIGVQLGTTGDIYASDIAGATIERYKAGSSPYVTPEGTEYPNGKLIMATNAQFPPYELVENGEVVGFDVDMMTAVCDKLGYELEIENMDFDSIITAVDSGKADVGAAGMTVTEDRLKNIDFSDPYTTATQVIIVRVK